MNNTLKNIVLTPMNLLYKINPKLEIQLMFIFKHGYKLDLNNPITYNEKLNWMKVYYRNDLMPKCADKYLVRDYIIKKGYKDWLPRLLWEGKDPNKIPFNKLPDKFVIKVTHGAGNNIICTNKTELNKKKIIKKLKRWLKQKYLPAYGEWFYGIEEPRIIVEEFLSEDGYSLPKDYKFYCFNNINGEHGLGIIAVHKDRFSKNITKSIYNSRWEFERDVIFGAKPDTKNIEKKPKMFEEMVECSKILSEPFPHARIDFYIINEKVYIGEITFMTGAGFNKITPRSFDEKLGSWIKLPTNSK